MAGFIPTASEFVPIAIFLGLFFSLVLYVKYLNRLNLRSVGSDMCLSAVFIQITLLGVPLWMSKEFSINFAGQLIVVVLTLFAWMVTVWLLRRRKPSRTRSTNLFSRFIDYLKQQSNIRECLSFILGAFAMCISLMMILDVIEFGISDWITRTTHLLIASLVSVFIGYGGYSIYRYLQNEQLTQSFEKFSKEITRDNVLMTVQTGGTQMHDRDPTQPVVDIIRGSIMKGVLGPSMFGLEILKKSCMELLTTSGMRKQSLERINLHFVGHIDDIGKLALRMDEDEVANESIESIGEIGVCAVSKGLEVPVEDILRRLSEYYDVLHHKEFEIMKLTVAKSIGRIGKAAAARGIKSPPTKAVNMLGIIGAPAVRDRDKNAISEIIAALFAIGMESAVNSLEGPVRQSALKLRDMGSSAVQNCMVDEALQIVANLEEMGTAAASNKLELGTEQVIWSLKDMGVTYGYQHVESGINAAVGALGSVGLESSLRKLDDAVDQALWSLKEISSYPISEGLEKSIARSAQVFASLAEFEQDRVDRTLKDLQRYFGSDEAARYERFDREYRAASKAAGSR